MTIKPGILLNPMVLQNPAALMTVVGTVLAAPNAPLGSVRDELGDIAEVLRERGVPQGERLSTIVASPEPIAEYVEEIKDCVSEVNLEILIRALERSAQRFAEDAEDVARAARKMRHTVARKGKPIACSEEEIAAALTATQSTVAAAKMLGITRQAVTKRLAQATEKSLLMTLKDKFNEWGHRPKKWSDDIVAAVLIATPLKEAARLLGMTQQALRHKNREG